MSIDLEWDTLFRSSLASSLVDVINEHLSTTSRPSFIGPVTVTSLDFGSAPPDVEVVDVREIYRDFLEDDEDEGNTKVREDVRAADDLDGFEWVSRKGVGKAVAEEAPSYHHLPPHVRYGRGPSTDPFSGTPGSPRDMWQGTMSVPNLSDALRSPPLYRSMLGTPSTQFPTQYASPPLFPSSTPPAQQHAKHEPPPPAASATAPNEVPNLQLHLRVTHQSNLRLTITTSLLINYPSPSFMSLPIKLSVTGLIFTGEIVVAYEGVRRRVHLCILDDLDPYGPAGDRSNRQSLDSEYGPTDPDTRSGKPLPAGLRLLPSIFIETEIGQADKHVLKNVTRVERFIQDVIRKTVEEELLFPNYHTLLLGDS
jgi:mitochondrial distribution and morphology protein 12